ncbi:MAG TPA: phosphate signaling complex protein PhoU [Candidatus Eisenbacteria bacterium]|nr:phosphate signaling complex protein PhoU [Candidatus Eisenbacteria bacterium]
MESPIEQSQLSITVETGRSRGALDRDERQVKDGILRMGSLVEAQIRNAIQALVNRDPELALQVIEGDGLINEAQRSVNDAVAMTIATQAPVARDLRFLLALHHVGYELERIGDHASSVAKQVRRLSDERSLPAIGALGRMGGLAADQVRGILEAVVDVDQARAREVATADDEIDHLYHSVFADVVRIMGTDPTAVDRGTRLILIAHWVERIGDRVTNIAEDVVYLATGEVEDLN